MGEISTGAVLPLADYDQFFKTPQELGLPDTHAVAVQELGQICVDSRGLVGVPVMSLQEPGDIRSIVTAAQLALERPTSVDDEKVLQALSEHFNWIGHLGCKFRQNETGILQPIATDNEAVRNDALKISMGVLDHNSYDERQQAFKTYHARPTAQTRWQSIEHQNQMAALRNQTNTATHYIANGVKNEYWQAGEAYSGSKSAFVQSVGDAALPLAHEVRTILPIRVEDFLANLAILGASTANLLGVQVETRETSFAKVA